MKVFKDVIEWEILFFIFADFPDEKLKKLKIHEKSMIKSKS